MKWNENSCTMPPKIRKLGGGNERRVGEVAQVSETLSAIPVNFANLYKDDLVLVKRTDSSWTYAVVKETENGPNASVVVIVNSRGAFKKISQHRCAKYLRKVMDEDDSQTVPDKLSTGSISSSHSSTRTCDEVSIDNSVFMRTILEVIEMSYSHHTDHGSSGNMPHHGDSMQRLVGELGHLYSEEKDKSKCGNCSLIGSTDDSCRKRLGEHCSEPRVKQSQLPNSSLLKPSTQKLHSLQEKERLQRHVTFNIHQDRELESNRLNDALPAMDKLPTVNETPGIAAQSEPVKPQRRRSWSMEVKGMAEGMLQIPRKKMEDLDMGEMSPLCNYRHKLWSNNNRVFDVEKLPIFVRRHEKNSEETIEYDENVSLSKKKLNELKMGDVIPKVHGQAGFESFQHALRSIHRRSSVFLPPVSGGGVTLH